MVAPCGNLLQPLNLGGDENQQLAAFVADVIALEQPAEQRDSVKPWGPILRRLLAAHVDPADDRRLAVAHQHTRVRAPRVDGRDVVYLAVFAAVICGVTFRVSAASLNVTVTVLFATV